MDKRKRKFLQLIIRPNQNRSLRLSKLAHDLFRADSSRRGAASKRVPGMDMVPTIDMVGRN